MGERNEYEAVTVPSEKPPERHSYVEHRAVILERMDGRGIRTC